MKVLVTVALLLGMTLTAKIASAESYSFKLTNTTKSKMVKLLVSEDGKKWAPFDIGKGIAPGESATMEWDESTNNEGCEQKVKAVYDDKTESEPATFDFCEEGLDLEF